MLLVHVLAQVLVFWTSSPSDFNLEPGLLVPPNGQQVELGTAETLWPQFTLGSEKTTIVCAFMLHQLREVTKALMGLQHTCL